MFSGSCALESRRGVQGEENDRQVSYRHTCGKPLNLGESYNNDPSARERDANCSAFVVKSKKACPMPRAMTSVETIFEFRGEHVISAFPPKLQPFQGYIC